MDTPLILIDDAIIAIKDRLGVSMIDEPNEGGWFSTSNLTIYYHENGNNTFNTVTTRVIDFFQDHKPAGFSVDMYPHPDDNSLVCITFNITAHE